MKVYIGANNDVSRVLTKNDINVLWYPEMYIPYNKWFEFLNSEEFKNATYCATQSSELIKSLEVNRIDCTILIYYDNDFHECTIYEARQSLLSCYESLMVYDAITDRENNISKNIMNIHPDHILF